MRIKRKEKKKTEKGENNTLKSQDIPLMLQRPAESRVLSLGVEKKCYFKRGGGGVCIILILHGKQYKEATRQRNPILPLKLLSRAQFTSYFEL